MDTLFGRTRADLAGIVAGFGAPVFAVDQLCDWLYKKHADSFDACTNLSKALRAGLAEGYALGVAAPTRFVESADGTKKYLFPADPAAPGDAGTFSIESAFIPDGERATLCVSTQVGCRMGCVFCMTGRQGLQAQLSAGAICNQFRSLPERDRLTNVVYMGMGEPLDNLDAVLASLEVFTADWGYAWSPTRITVSSVGVLPALGKFLAATRAHFALSLHSPFDDERRSLMPAANAAPLADIFAELARYDFRGQRRLTMEYLVFDGVNDSPRHAQALARLLRSVPARINLLAYNTLPGGTLAGASREAMEEFQNILKAAGFVATIRRSRGQDIDAACGLLSTKGAGGVAQG